MTSAYFRDADTHTTTDDYWEVRSYARFATPDEFAAYKWIELTNETDSFMSLRIITEALIAAADSDGVLLDFVMPDWYREYVEKDLTYQADMPIRDTYSIFVATVLMESLLTLQGLGLIAHRGNGDTVDYRLTLPTSPSDLRIGQISPLG